MSITAMILTQTLERRAALTTRYGRSVIDNSLFVLAARLIAGTNKN